MSKILKASILLIFVLLSQGFDVDSFEVLDEDNLRTIKYQCSFYEQFAIFTYKPIEDKIPDSEFKSLITEPGVVNKFAYFSFCNDSNITCTNVEPQYRGPALLRDDTSNECTRVTSDNWNDVKVTYVKNKEDRSKDYLRLNWTGGDPCDFNVEKDWGFSIDVVCANIAYDKSTYSYVGGYDESCLIRTEFVSKLGCSIVSYREISEFFQNNRIIFAIVLIVLGFFLTFFGYRLIIISLFIAGVIVTMFAAGVIAYTFFITSNTPQYVFWIVLGWSAVLGCIVGLALVKFRRFGIFILAVLGGACVGLVLNNAVMRYAQSKALFWVVIAGCGAAWGIVSCFFYIIIAIASTSMIGSYAVVRGASAFIGHFPDEVTIIEQIKNGTAPKTSWQFWVYLLAICILFIIGFFIQWKCRPERNEKKKAGNTKDRKNGEYYRVRD